MRLAVIRQYYPNFGGEERFVEAALEALLERNVAISLYSRQWPQTKLQLIEPVVCNPFHIGALWRDWGFARAACRAIAAADPDLVESYERLMCCDIYRARDGVHATALEELGRVASAWARTTVRINPYHRYVLALERKLYASPWLRAVICRSRMVGEDINRRFGVAKERIHVIHDAVDTDAFHPGLRSLRGWVRERHRISDSATVFLLVGSGYRRQGVPVAVAALARLAPTAHLVVVGADRDVSRYQRLAQQYGVEDRVTFAGPQVEPKPYYGAADVLVLPTLYDACPAAALEAMACGLPVITSAQSGAAELVLQHDAGLVGDALDVITLSRHMRLMQDESPRVRAAANARQCALELTPAALTLKLVLLYRDLLAGSVSARGTPPAGSVAGAASGSSRTQRTTPVTQHSAMDLVSPEIAIPPAFASAAAELPTDDGQPPPPLLDISVAPEVILPELSIGMTQELATREITEGPHSHGP